MRETTLEVFIVLTSNRYLPGLMFDVLAEVIDMVISPFDASVIVHMILAVALAE
jgi:hypothetical protein